MASKKIRLEPDVSEDPNVSSLSANNTIASNSSGGPFRGRYSRPLGGGSLSASSRFSPYSISRDRPSSRRAVPIIRARREDNGSVSSLDLNTSANTSSTAQKIIETLASMSTPVLNAGRVRIDSIKTVKPLLSGVPAFSSGSMLAPSSKFNGPPKTASPLMLPKYTTGIRPASLDSSSWLLKSLNVPPKMVDSGTNTDEPMNTKSEDSLSETLSPTGAVDNSSSVVVLPFMAGNGLKGPTNGVASEEFAFSDPWPLTELDDYVGDRHSTAGEEESSTSSSEDEENENSNEEAESLANGDVYDGEKGRRKVKEVSGSKIESPYTISISANKKKWECPSCMVFNEQEESECVCCATKNPSSSSSTPSASASVSTAKKWDCPECMVPNQPTAATCVCCSTPNPNNKTTATEKTEKKPAAKWTCPTCMVPNEATSNACVCCTEPNPNPVSSDGDKSKSLTSALPVTSTFKFGFSSSTAASTSATNTGFTFGAPSTSSSTPSPSSFKFGVASTTAIAGSKLQPTTTSSSTSSGFTFGAPSSKSPASTTPIKFGVSSGSKAETETSQKPAEVWKCDICPGKNKMDAISCRTCNSPRPQDFDPTYVAPPEKPKNNSRFEPKIGIPKSTAPSTVSVPPIKSGVTLFSSSTSTAQPAPSVSTGPSITSGIGSGFGSGTTFSSGNPFGTGVAAFGSSGSSSSFGSSIGSGTTFGTLVPVTTTSTPSGFSTGLPSFSSPGVSTAPPERQGFQFGSATQSSPTKRKLEDGSDGGDPAKKISHSVAPSFAFGSSSETTSSFSFKEPSAFPTSQPSAQIGITPGGSNPPAFLEALKNASAAVKASSEKQSNTVTSTSGPANKGFQFGVTPTTTTTVSNSGTFGMANQTLTPAQTFTFGSGAPAPSFGSSSETGGGFSSNSGQMFGSMGSASGMGQSQLSAAAPAAPQFTMNPTNFNFGSPAPPSTTTFNFGATAAAAPGGQPSASPAPLFQFAASSPGPAGEQRKIRRATRRFNR